MRAEPGFRLGDLADAPGPPGGGVQAVPRRIDQAVLAELDVHVICDNSSTDKTPAIRRWLVAHPRVRLHFTPTYSSWLNLVERWFSS
jgi:hypothetical protein